MLGKPHILSLFLNSFEKKTIKYEHSCKILYIENHSNDIEKQSRLSGHCASFEDM